MNFEFTDDQRAIKRTANEFLAARYKLETVRSLAEDERGFTDEQWTQIADLGWPGVIVPESDGGLGLGAVELVVIQEEMGYALAPSPLLSSVQRRPAAGGGGDRRAEGSVAAGTVRRVFAGHGRRVGLRRRLGARPLRG